MRSIHLFLGIGGLAAIASTVLLIQAVQPPPEDRFVADTMPAEAEEQVGPSASKELVTPRAVARESAREAVAVPEPAADPCASVTADLEAALIAKATAEKEVHELRDVVRRLHGEVALLKGELARRPVPEDTPYGAFLASPEAKKITDPKLRAAFRALLDDFPVMLRPGEAAWIADNSKRRDWGGYAYPDEEDLIHFLGPARLAAEIPLDKLLEEDHLSDEDYGPALQAALPPEKRAALAARLQALMEESNDPEEVAWLLERFPTFFD